MTELENEMAVPVALGVGAGKEDDLTYNRNLRMKDGTDYTFRGWVAPPRTGRP